MIADKAPVLLKLGGFQRNDGTWILHTGYIPHHLPVNPTRESVSVRMPDFPPRHVSEFPLEGTRLRPQFRSQQEGRQQWKKQKQDAFSFYSSHVVLSS